MVGKCTLTLPHMWHYIQLTSISWNWNHIGPIFLQYFPSKLISYSPKCYIFTFSLIKYSTLFPVLTLIWFNHDSDFMWKIKAINIETWKFSPQWESTLIPASVCMHCHFPQAQWMIYPSCYQWPNSHLVYYFPSLLIYLRSLL